MTEYEFKQVGIDRNSIAEASQLLADTFDRPELFTPDYIKWQYADNPDGQIVGFNAFLNGELGAHYVAQPFNALVDGKEAKGLLSLNTATGKGHRGKGLFPKLAEHTYALAKEQGFDLIIGVANQNSVNGFVNKLGFQLVGQFAAMAGIGKIPIPRVENKVSYIRRWNAETLEWRLTNPSNPYYTVNRGNGIQVFSRTTYPMVDVALGTFSHNEMKEMNCAQKNAPVLKIWIGMDARMDFSRTAFLNIPPKLRPAPLYLIYKSLAEERRTLDASTVVFQALDFDAY